jgi:hypothetical protein
MSKKLLSLALASFLGTSALCAGKVSIADDGLGDFLIAPLYIAKNDVCSEIKVFNTNERSSILAKVTFREQISSQEVDLPIFLSPGDVWSAEVCQAGKSVILKSTDDSNHPNVKKILKEGKNLTRHSQEAGHKEIDFTKGYVEVYPIAQFNEPGKQKIDKSLLVTRWDALIAKAKAPMNISKYGVSNNALSGLVSFKSSGVETAALPMKAFKGAHDKQVTGAAIAYSSDTSPEILLGQSKKSQILQLLANDTVSFTYDKSGEGQYLHLTCPFGYTKGQIRSFKATIRDMSENKNIVKTVIFSPAPTGSEYAVENEVAMISVEELIKIASNAQQFKKGMIQIKEIKNVTDVGLGQNKTASYIPTLTRTSNCGNIMSEQEVINIMYVPAH